MAETESNPLRAFSAAMEAVLQLSGAGQLLEALNRITKLLEGDGITGVPEPPAGCREDIRHLAAVLSLDPTPQELLRIAPRLDLRDLVEAEIAYLEQVTVKTVQAWRQNGTGPDYRNEAGIRYPVSWYIQWRRKGYQILTSQKKTRGRRSSPCESRN